MILLKKWSLIILNVSTLVTSLTILMTIPNGIVDSIKSANWINNVSLIRFSSIDYIVIYNDNPNPIFLDRFEYRNDDLGVASTHEINQVIPPYSFNTYNTDQEKIKWDKIFKGNDESLKRVIESGLNNMKSNYQFVLYNYDHHIFSLLESTNNMPRLFETQVKLFLRYKEEIKEKQIVANGIIVDKSLQ